MPKVLQDSLSESMADAVCNTTILSKDKNVVWFISTNFQFLSK